MIPPRLFTSVTLDAAFTYSSNRNMTKEAEEKLLRCTTHFFHINSALICIGCRPYSIFSTPQFFKNFFFQIIISSLNHFSTSHRIFHPSPTLSIDSNIFFPDTYSFFFFRFDLSTTLYTRTFYRRILHPRRHLVVTILEGQVQ